MKSLPPSLTRPPRAEQIIILDCRKLNLLITILLPFFMNRCCSLFFLPLPIAMYVSVCLSVCVHDLLNSGYLFRQKIVWLSVRLAGTKSTQNM